MLRLRQYLARLALAHISLLLLGAIVLGAAIGQWAPTSGQWLGEQVDPTLLLLITLLFFGVRFGAIVRALGNLRFIAVILLLNFGLIPLIGYAIAALVLPEHPLLMVGLLIYFMSPCTDWVLGFTRLAKGNLALGTALVPINMLLQLLLYPLYLYLFTRHLVQVDPGTLGSTLVQWFLLPLLLAQGVHHGLRRMLGEPCFERLLERVDQFTPWLIAVLVLEIFASNITVMLANQAVLGWLLVGVFSFFVVTFALGEGVSRLLRLDYPEHALLTMSLAARNAPMMLAVSMAALPGQPLIYAAIVMGMLLEFPHLTLLRHLLLGSQRQPGPPVFQPQENTS